jgi:hypothetical protein
MLPGVALNSTCLEALSLFETTRKIIFGTAATLRLKLKWAIMVHNGGVAKMSDTPFFCVEGEVACEH